MRPLDPRLLAVATSLRTLVPVVGALAAVQAVATIAFAWGLGTALAQAIAGVVQAQPLVVAAIAIVVRGAATWADEALAARSSASVRSQLRLRALEHCATVAPESPVVAATVLGRGLEALDPYFGKFLPQLTRSLIAVPILVLALLLQDAFSGIAVAITLPLVPVFMALIGMATLAVQRRQWLATERLARSLLDTLEGLGTLKIFRRDRRAGALVRERSAEHGARTMQVLRISFLSSMVLELAASLAIAIVAVSVGIRLIDGDISLATAFSVLILAPDVFLPVRLVGGAFHASTEGVTATSNALDLLEAEPATAAAVAKGTGLVLEDAGAARSESLVTASLQRGEFVVLTGPSGAGKTSLLLAMMGFTAAVGHMGFDGKAITLDDCSWAPQRAQDAIVSGSVFDNISLGAHRSDNVEAAARLTAVDLDFDRAIDAATGGVDGASGGQLQRVVLARAVRKCLDGAPILLADEPTSALNHDTEVRVIEGLRLLADRGHLVVVTSHRPAVIGAADRCIAVGA